MLNGYILLDAGGTQIKSAAFSDSGNRLGSVHMADSRAQAGKEAILENFLSVISREKDILAANGYVPGCVGIAFPGPFDYRNGISHMRGLGKYDAIEGVPLEEALKNYPGQTALERGTRFFFRHDVDSFALGVTVLDPSCAEGRVICLCVGTGAGSAFLENGRLLKQDRRVPENGWIYPFPFRGMTVDDWVSARGLERLARESGFPAGTTGKDLYGLAAQGDARAAAIWKEFGTLVADALRPFAASFRPGGLVLGGQISKAERFFGDAIKDRFPDLTVRTVSDTTESIFRGLLAADRDSGELQNYGGDR